MDSEIKKPVTLIHRDQVKPMTQATKPLELNEAVILAEPSLAFGWVGPDADDAWKHLNELPDLDKQEEESDVGRYGGNGGL